MSRKGAKLTDEHKRKISISHVGKKMPPFTTEHRRKLSLSKMGSNSPFWRGGVSKEHKRIRETLEYRLWRESVFTRDKWTCVWCGQVGGKLNADHIKPFAYYPELRFAIDNGRTLCEPCHRTTDTFAGKAQSYKPVAQ